MKRKKVIFFIMIVSAIALFFSLKKSKVAVLVGMSVPAPASEDGIYNFKILMGEDSVFEGRIEPLSYKRIEMEVPVGFYRYSVLISSAAGLYKESSIVPLFFEQTVVIEYYPKWSPDEKKDPEIGIDWLPRRLVD